MPASEIIYAKITNWCAYQERSHAEVRRKLLGFGLSEQVANEMIARLISENYINEERFATALAGGKFRMKKWGRIKIKMELRKHAVSEYSIKKALASIDEQDYEKALKELIEKKKRALKSPISVNDIYKIRNYAISRGFEPDLVAQFTNKFENQYES